MTDDEKIRLSVDVAKTIIEESGGLTSGEVASAAAYIVATICKDFEDGTAGTPDPTPEGAMS